MNLNIDVWKEFKVSSIFSIHNGRGITKEEISDNPGTFTVVQSGEENNGILGKIDLDYCKSMNYTLSEKPCLTVARSGSAGFVSYQPNGCVVGDSAKILLLKYDNSSDSQYLFLQTILTANRFKYAYGRKVTEEKYMNDIIKLPVQHNSDGSLFIDPTYKYSEDGYIPSWDFMENYIKSLHYKTITTKNKVGQAPNLKINTWKDFYLGNLFDIFTGGDLILSEMDEGIIPVASHKVENNGVGALVDTIIGRQIFDYNKTIALADRGCFHASVQTKNFYIGTRVKALVIKENISIEALLFLTTVINQESFKYSYGRNCTAGVEHVIISLPIQHNPDGSPYIDNTHQYSEEGYVPDWKFMNNYIKSLPYGDRIGG